MGGYVLTRLSAERPDAFGHLVLIDPVIMAPELYGGADALPVPDPAEHPVARRRNRWTGAEAMRGRFADRAPYSRWVPVVMGDYCTDGSLHVGDGYAIAFPPAHDVPMYTHAPPPNNIHKTLDLVR